MDTQLYQVVNPSMSKSFPLTPPQPILVVQILTTLWSRRWTFDGNSLPGFLQYKTSIVNPVLVQNQSLKTGWYFFTGITNLSIRYGITDS